MTVRLAFGENMMAAAPSWTDVSGLALDFSIRRGRQHELDRIEAGEATVTLRNMAGDFWPLNAAGAYYDNVRPLVRLNIRATYSAVTYDLFTGFVESWRHSFLPGSANAIVTLTAVDGMKALARYELNNAGYAAEAAGTRIGNALDSLGWPAADRSLNAGQTVVIATGALADQGALGHVQDVLDTELGLLFVAGNNYMTYHDRHARLKGDYLTSQATYGDDSPELPYQGFLPEHDDQRIINDVRATRSGGTEQTASDATSQGRYGTRTEDRTGLLHSTDNEVLDYANYRLSRWKEPDFRLRSLTIKPQRQEADEFPDVLGFDLGTRITVRLDLASVNHDYHIEGIEHRANGSNNFWETTWWLTPAAVQQYWLVGVVGFSEVGTTTVVGY